MSCTLSPIHSAKRIVGAACIIRDITERKRVEQAAGRLAAIVESSQDAIISKTVEGVIISWNAAAQRIYGYSAAEAVGRHISILSPHGREHENAQLLARVAAGERVNHLETVRRRKDGSLIDVSLTVSPVRDHAGRIVGISAIGRDFTEHKRAERELERLAQAAEHGTDSVISTDLQGRICHWSQGAERLYGFTAQEAIGHTVEHLSHSAENPQSDNDRARALSRMLAGERGYRLETQSRRRDGRVVELLIKFTPWKVDGRIVGVTTVTNDITERKQIERARERALADLEEAQRIARVGSWTWDPGSDEASWSAQMYEIFARDPSHGPATGESFFELVAAEDREVTRAGYTQVFGGGPSFTLDYRVLAGGGVTRAVHAVGHEEPARPGCYLGTVQDVSEQRAAERALREAQERFRLAFEEAPIGMAVISADGTLEYANAALGIICGRLRHELHGLRLWELIHPADRHGVSDALKALTSGDLDKLVRELRVLPATRSAVEVSIHATVLRYGAAPAEQAAVPVFQDITDRKQYESRLQFMADHDPLTGLMNRRKFEAELDRHVAHVKRYGPEGALLMLDIDNFKAVNDTLGHNAGDELIVSIAGVLSQRVRASDVLARLGGDEFAVLLPRADHAEAALVAGALVSAVRENAALLGGQRQKVTTSVGIAMFDAADSALTGESALIEGDLAMYDAKDNGRNGYAFYASADHRISRTKARLTWVTRIEQALASDRFALVAQPILDIRTNRIGQHELLLRMLDEHDDMIPPAAFLYIAERFELISRNRPVGRRARDRTDRRAPRTASAREHLRQIARRPKAPWNASTSAYAPAASIPTS